MHSIGPCIKSLMEDTAHLRISDGAFHGPFSNKTIGFWIPFQDVSTESGCLHSFLVETVHAYCPIVPLIRTIIDP
jgi:hypothetical protein